MKIVFAILLSASIVAVAGVNPKLGDPCNIPGCIRTAVVCNYDNAL